MNEAVNVLNRQVFNFFLDKFSRIHTQVTKKFIVSVRVVHSFLCKGIVIKSKEDYRLNVLSQK